MEGFSEAELMIMQEPSDSFLLLWAGTVCKATSRFLHRWYEVDTGTETRRRTVLECRTGKFKQEFKCELLKRLQSNLFQAKTKDHWNATDHWLFLFSAKRLNGNGTFWNRVQPRNTRPYIRSKGAHSYSL